MPKGPNDHYTATVQIHKVDFTNKVDDRGYSKDKPVERVVTDIASIVVRAESLEELKTKVLNHVEII